MKQRKRSFGFWAAVVLVAGGVLYPFCVGPWCVFVVARQNGSRIGYSISNDDLLVCRPVDAVLKVFPDSVRQGWAEYIDEWAQFGGRFQHLNRSVCPSP